MRVIAPNLSCFVTEEEYEQNAHEGHSIVYIQGRDGKRWKHCQLTNGGHVRYEIKAVPGEDQAPITQMSEDIKFLPNGRIPRVLLDQIVEFFREVMVHLNATNNVKHGQLEAMAHILWNPEDGYHIGIPSQEVSAASVKYEFDDVKDNDMIVVDIHSHNSMGAFFSGTDDRDDARGIWISGVVGKLTSNTYETVWRFNCEDFKKELKVNDIFTPADVPAVPKEWLEKVQKYTYKYTGKGRQPYQGNLYGQDYWGDDYGFGGHGGYNNHRGFSGHNNPTGRRASKKPQAPGLGAEKTKPHLTVRPGISAKYNSDTHQYEYRDKQGRRLRIVNDDFVVMNQNEIYLADTYGVDILDYEDDMGTGLGLNSEEALANFFGMNFLDEQSEELIDSMMGDDADGTKEEALDQIDLYLQDINGDDKALSEVLKSTYEHLSEDAKALIVQRKVAGGES